MSLRQSDPGRYQALQFDYVNDVESCERAVTSGLLMTNARRLREDGKTADAGRTGAKFCRRSSISPAASTTPQVEGGDQPLSK